MITVAEPVIIEVETTYVFNGIPEALTNNPGMMVGFGNKLVNCVDALDIVIAGTVRFTISLLMIIVLYAIAEDDVIFRIPFPEYILSNEVDVIGVVR